MAAEGPSNRAQFLSSAGAAAAMATSAVMLPTLASADEEEGQVRTPATAYHEDESSSWRCCFRLLQERTRP